MTQENEKRVCPNCGHENESDVVACVNCGTPLNPSTVRVPISRLPVYEPEEEKPAEEPKPRPAGGIALWVRNDPHPVLIEPDEGVILGRETDAKKDPPSLVNLARYNAYRLGVSRRHAQIECKGDSCLLLDLGSSNGTWINGLKLRPYQPAVLKSGDRVNLARLEFIVGPLTDEARARAGLPTLQLIKNAGLNEEEEDEGEAPPGRITQSEPPAQDADKSGDAAKAANNQPIPSQEHKPTGALNNKPQQEAPSEPADAAQPEPNGTPSGDQQAEAAQPESTSPDPQPPKPADTNGKPPGDAQAKAPEAPEEKPKPTDNNDT